jgi:hypothetical protein
MDAPKIIPGNLYWVETPKGQLKIIVVGRATTVADGWLCRLPEGSNGIVVFKANDFLRAAES